MRLIVLFVLFTTCVWGQRPTFEVASIRPGNPESRQLRASISAGRLTAENVTLRVLIEDAYDLKPFQLTGGPRWIDSDGFAILAQGAASATNAQVKLMLQVLLAERFQLSMHKETKEQPVYALQVKDRSKLKLQPSPEGGRSQLMISTKGMADPGITYTFRKHTMERLADILSRETQRLVIDETGIAGEFDFELSATRELEEKNPFSAPLAPLISNLGLKLESRRGPVEFYIVDRAEQPSEN